MNKLAFCHTSQAIRLIVEYVALGTMERKKKNKASHDEWDNGIVGKYWKDGKDFLLLLSLMEKCVLGLS